MSFFRAWSPFPDDEIKAGWVDGDDVEGVEALFPARRLQLAVAGEHAAFWDALFARALAVAPQGVAQVGLQVVAADTEASRAGPGDVACAFALQNVGIIDDESLFRGNAGAHQELFTVAGFEHVEIDAHVGAEKTLLVEGGFPGALDADQEHCFHAVIIREKSGGDSAPCYNFCMISGLPRHTRYQAAILVGRQILLIRHRHHDTGRTYWLLPGGGREPGETEEECVRREMREETGLEVRVERLLCVHDTDHAGPGYMQHKTYLCTPVAGEASPGYEPEEEASAIYGIVEVRWVDLWDESGWDDLMRSDAITNDNLARVRAALGGAAD
jgi:ADP-ribose pyrophosphatase YjhB (NUDIX family)